MLATLLFAAAVAAAPPAPPACRVAAGAAGAARMVRACIYVSPATHPPCNAANSCDLILQEIKRSCALWREGDNPPRPAICRDYETPVPKR